MDLVKGIFGTMSLTYSKKSRGPKMLPWGTPHFASAFDKRTRDDSTNYFVPAKYDENKAKGTL